MTPAALDKADKVMADAIAGRFTKDALTSMLTAVARPAFRDACGRIEKQYTDACAAEADPCLESGCSCEGEICLQPLLRRDAEYRAACGGQWVKLFAVAANRDQAWESTSERPA